MSIVANQIISKGSPFLSQDFIDLSSYDIIDLFFQGSVAKLYVRNTDGTLSYGEYTEGLTGWSGSLTLVSSNSYFPESSNIFIVENTYEQNEFFMFYNVDGQTKFRTFNSAQGYFSLEKTLDEEHTVKQIQRVYENIIFVIEETASEEVFQYIQDLPNKRLKLAFLFTAEIEKWNRTENPPLFQIIEKPFDGINEFAYTVENLAGEGFMYIKGNQTLSEFDSRAINGGVVKKFEEIFTRMAKIDNYTLTMRFNPRPVTEESVIVTTNNYQIKYDGSKIILETDQEQLTEFLARDANAPCETTEGLVPNQLPPQRKEITANIEGYGLLFVTNTYSNGVNIITLYMDRKEITITRDHRGLTDYTQDVFLKLENIFSMDYLSQQKYALNREQVVSLQQVYTNGANAPVTRRKRVFSYQEVNRLLFDDSDQILVDSTMNETISNVSITSTLTNPVQLNWNDMDYTYAEVGDIEGTGKLKIVQNDPEKSIYGKITIEYDVNPAVHDIVYTNNHKLNVAYKYKFGKYLPIDSGIDKPLLRGTVVPYKITPESEVPRVIFANPKEELRIGNSTSQIFDRVPFVIEDRYETGDYIVWVSLDNFADNGIPIQYGLIDKDIMDPHTYSQYETLSSGTYNQSDYYFAYHFTELREENNILLKKLYVRDSGELFIVGTTYKNDYVREIREIRFMDIPKKYKTNFFRVNIDSEQESKQSFINNNVEIRRITREIIKEWKPAHTNLIDIRESNAVIMSTLLSDEFAQVLVGFTPNSNVNSYYVRSVESGELDIYTSSGRFDENIDWLAIGRLDSPYVKAGVTKVNKAQKQFKIFFESRFNTTDYRVMVFNPNNSKYYVPEKDQDGFIVESSYLVEEEVSWIAVNSNQVINGTIVWKKGIPEDEKRVSNLDRVTEIGINSHKYTLNFNDFGFDNFSSTDYSVILSSDSNINLWYSDKKLNSVDIRRSYTGEDMEVDYLIVRGNNKWYDQITG